MQEHIVQLRRTLRNVRPLRRAFYWARDNLTRTADPLSLRFVPEEKFRECIRRVVTLMQARKTHIGDYLEFGVFNGTSLSIVFDVYREMGLTEPRFYGFDSFEGLPEDEEGLWMKGECKCSLPETRAFLTQRGIAWERTQLMKGWFEDTLTPELATRIPKASLIMIDCDLYASALSALRFCAPLIKDEAVIIFDDWEAFQADEQGKGERRAFEEFLREQPPFSYTGLGPSYSSGSRIFRVVRT